MKICKIVQEGLAQALATSDDVTRESKGTVCMVDFLEFCAGAASSRIFERYGVSVVGFDD